MSLTLTPLPNIPMINTGDDLSAIIWNSLKQAEIRLIDGDILVVAQKVVSKAEGRWVNLAMVSPSKQAIELGRETEKDPRLVELVLQESNEILRKRNGTIIVEHRLGFVCANAGIDHSNVAGVGSVGEELVLLLPEKPDESAQIIRQNIEALSGAGIGVLIIDSHGRAWRQGVVGVTIGISGVPALVDMRGKPDLFGYNLRITMIGAADELAAAASLVMGQADEATPVVHARGFPYSRRESTINDILRPKDQDLFR